MRLGNYYFHIDEPNQKYEVIREGPAGYFYAVLFHPSFKDIKHFTKEDIDKTFFSKSEDCLDARIERIKRKLQLEIDCKNKKI